MFAVCARTWRHHPPYRPSIGAARAAGGTARGAFELTITTEKPHHVETGGEDGLEHLRHRLRPDTHPGRQPRRRAPRRTEADFIAFHEALPRGQGHPRAAHLHAHPRHAAIAAWLGRGAPAATATRLHPVRCSTIIPAGGEGESSGRYADHQGFQTRSPPWHQGPQALERSDGEEKRRSMPLTEKRIRADQRRKAAAGQTHRSGKQERISRRYGRGPHGLRQSVFFPSIVSTHF